MTAAQEFATQNSPSIIDWPLTASTATATGPKDLRAAHSKTPYQPHHGYEQEYLNRQRLITTLICLAFALFSDVVATTLYVLVGLQEGKAEWLFRSWIVVSAGSTVMLAFLAVTFWRNYVRARRSEDPDFGKGTPLKAIGRKEIQRESQSIARAPLVTKGKQGYASDSLPSPATVLHRSEPHQSPCSSYTTTDTPKPTNTYTITANHLLSPISPTEIHGGQTTSSPSPTTTPPPPFPQPAVLRDATAPTEKASVDVFYDSNTQRDGSPDSTSTIKALEAQIARSDSLKKLREATLRRKQAREVLK